MELIFHSPTDYNTASPFQAAIARVAGDGVVDIACPYLSLSLLCRTVERAEQWRLLTDVIAWFSIVPSTVERERLAEWCTAHQGHIRHLPGLHAKVVLGRVQALVSSANLTDMGTLRRVEMGVLITQGQLIQQLRHWFSETWSQGHELTAETFRAIAHSAPNLCPPVKHKAGQLEGLMRNPVCALPAFTLPRTTRPARVRTIEDLEDAWDLLEKTLVQRVDRNWAETYFAWLEDLICITRLPEGDQQLTTTLIDKGRAIGVNLNNRAALTWSGRRRGNPPAVYYLLSAEYARTLEIRWPELVYRVHWFKRDRRDPTPPALILADFPPQFGEPETFRDEWRKAVLYEVGRRRGHSPRGMRRHKSLIYNLAVNRQLREKFFAQIWPSN